MTKATIVVSAFLLALVACSKPAAKPGPHRPPPTMAARLSMALGDGDPAAASCDAVMSQHLGGVACASNAGVMYAVYADEQGNALPPGSARCFCVDGGTGLFAMSPIPVSEDAGDDGGAEGGS